MSRVEIIALALLAVVAGLGWIMLLHGYFAKRRHWETRWAYRSLPPRVSGVAIIAGPSLASTSITWWAVLPTALIGCALAMVALLSFGARSQYVAVWGIFAVPLSAFAISQLVDI